MTYLLSTALALGAATLGPTAPTAPVAAVCPAETNTADLRARIFLQREERAATLSELGVSRDVARLRILTDARDANACRAIRDVVKDTIEKWNKLDYVLYQAGDRYLVLFFAKRPELPEGYVSVATGSSPVVVVDSNFKVVRVLVV